MTLAVRCSQVVCVCIVHVATAYMVRDWRLSTLFFAAWLIGGTCNQNLMTAQHELSHFLAFRRPLYNKILSLVSNMPISIPVAASFRKYHQEHHSDMVRACVWVVELGCVCVPGAGMQLLCTACWSCQDERPHCLDARHHSWLVLPRTQAHAPTHTHCLLHSQLAPFPLKTQKILMPGVYQHRVGLPKDGARQLPTPSPPTTVPLLHTFI